MNQRLVFLDVITFLRIDLFNNPAFRMLDRLNLLLRDDLANGTDGLGAILAAVTNLTGNTTASAVVPKALERPDSGSKTYRLHLMVYDLDGNMEAPDSTPTVVAENDQGTDRSSGLSAVSLVSTGCYMAEYTVASDHALEALTFFWSVTEGGKTRKVAAATHVVETTAETYTAADRLRDDALAARATEGRLAELDAGNLPADVDTLKTRVPGTVQPQSGDSYGRLGAPAGASIAADLAATKTVIDATKTIVDRIPDMTELSGGHYRFTAAALIEAPTGSGGSATITDTDLNNIADRVFDKADAIETGITLRKAVRAVAAVLVGKYTRGRTTAVFYGIGNPDTQRVSSETPAAGGRTTVTLSV